MAIEKMQVDLVVVALSSLVIFVLFYVEGGRNEKALRRYLGSSLFLFICTLISVLSGSFSYWQLLSWPALMAALTMGYGANKTAAKLRKRALYGLAVGGASAPYLLAMGQWEIFLFQVVLAVAASVFYGVKNPMSAVGEEAQISLFLLACWPFAAIK